MVKKIFITSILFAIAIFSYFFIKNKLFQKNNLRIGIIADIHNCEADKSSNPINSLILKKFVDYVNKEKIDFNVNLGDNSSSRVGNCSKTMKDDFDFVLDNLKTKSPMFNVIGDHDINSLESFEYYLEKTELEKSYYSFDIKDIHILVLDDVTGGDEVFEKCEKDSECSFNKGKFEEIKNILKDKDKLEKYLKANNLKESDLINEKFKYKDLYSKREKIVKESYSPESWDKGKIGENELKWIEEELKNTDKDKILIFSHHNLFKFQPIEKLYEIDNLERLNEILRSSGKNIVSISGDSHIWHEENINGIQYYVIDKFANSNGSWAIFEWNDDGYKLDKIIN